MTCMAALPLFDAAEMVLPAMPRPARRAETLIATQDRPMGVDATPPSRAADAARPPDRADPVSPDAAVRARKRARGQMAYHGGLAAEEQVARHYRVAGRPVRARRWRGTEGEIDMIVEDGAGLIFVEVKSAPTHAEAAEALGPRQFARMSRTAEEFLGNEPAGRLTPCRIDLALVDAMGRIEIVENLTV